MKILIIEDDNPDYNDIKECLPEGVEHVETVDRKKSWDDINLKTLPNDYGLCITDIVKHKGAFDSFNCPVFIEKFREGIANIASLYKHLGCGRIILITKVPPLELNKRLPDFLGCPDVETLFPMLFVECEDGKCYNGDVIEANKDSNFYLCNNGRVYTLTKPFDQNGNMLTNMDTWKSKLKVLLTGIVEKSSTLKQ